MSELLQPLLGTIKTVRKHISEHRMKFVSSEARTRASLVDPILDALGWDPTDPTLVEVEHEIDKKFADYALLRSDGKPAAIVEAKKLGKPLGGMDELGQIAMYALRTGTRLAVLTDGDRWQLYDLKKLDTDQFVFKVSLSDDAPQVAALRLLALWRENMVSGDWEPPPKPATAKPEPRRVRVGVAPRGDGWVSLAEVQVQQGQRAPVAIRIGDEPERATKYWNQVLLFTAEWLVKTRLLRSPEAIRLPRANRNLFSKDSKHPTGTPFNNPKRVTGSDLTLEVSWNAPNCVKHSKWLLQQFGQDPGIVQVRL